jgi:hypothetical protein
VLAALAHARERCAERWAVGERCAVELSGGGQPSPPQRGVLQFKGVCPQLGEGLWAGVELGAALGKHDGAVQGRRYFQCRPMHGVLVRIERLQAASHAASVSDDGGGDRDDGVDGEVAALKAQVPRHWRMCVRVCVRVRLCARARADLSIRMVQVACLRQEARQASTARRQAEHARKQVRAWHQHIWPRDTLGCRRCIALAHAGLTCADAAGDGAGGGAREPPGGGHVAEDDPGSQLGEGRDAAAGAGPTARRQRAAECVPTYRLPRAPATLPLSLHFRWCWMREATSIWRPALAVRGARGSA